MISKHLDEPYRCAHRGGIEVLASSPGEWSCINCGQRFIKHPVDAPKEGYTKRPLTDKQYEGWSFAQSQADKARAVEDEHVRHKQAGVVHWFSCWYCDDESDDSGDPEGVEVEVDQGAYDRGWDDGYDAAKQELTAKPHPTVAAPVPGETLDFDDEGTVIPPKGYFSAQRLDALMEILFGVAPVDDHRAIPTFMQNLKNDGRVYCDICGRVAVTSPDGWVHLPAPRGDGNTDV